MLRATSHSQRCASSPEPQESAQTRDLPAGRVPELAIAARLLRDRRLSAAEYAKAVMAFKPIRAYREVPGVSSKAQVRAALDRNKAHKAWTIGASVGDGDEVCARLDIPAFTRHGIWAISIHRALGNRAGPVLSYESWIALDHVTFLTHDRAALKIACGGPKAPMASIRGQYAAGSRTAVLTIAAAALKDPAWVQVGFDPERHAFFYTRQGVRPVLSAARLVQVGPLALAHCPVFGDASSFEF